MSARHHTDLSLNTQPPMNEARTPNVFGEYWNAEKGEDVGARDGAIQERLNCYNVMIREVVGIEIELLWVVYLDLARVFLRFRFKRLTRFFLHLARLIDCC